MRKGSNLGKKRENLFNFAWRNRVEHLAGLKKHKTQIFTTKNLRISKKDWVGIFRSLTCE